MVKYKKPLGYISSPYSKGDSAINARYQCLVFDKMLDDGYVLPYIPLLSHFQHTIFPRNYKDWINFDIEIMKAIPFKWLLRVNVVYQKLNYIEKRSIGADEEVRLFKQLYPEAPIIIQLNTESLNDVLTRLYITLKIKKKESCHDGSAKGNRS